MKLNRRALGIGLVAMLALLGSLAVATDVVGQLRPKVVVDRRGDGGSIDGRTHPGFCDILETTSKLARHGRIRHTVTTRGPIRPDFNAPPVLIKGQPVQGSNIGNVPLVLFPGQPGVHVHFKNHRRKTIYYLKRRKIKRAVHRRDKYYWLADQTNCSIHDDLAPNSGSVSQRLRTRHHHRR